MDDILVNFGSEIKVVGETADAWQIEGYAVHFGSQDLSALKDVFDGQTDYDIEDGEKRSIYFHHGLDGTIKREKLGRATFELKDAGVWYSGQIQKRTDYLKLHAEKIVDGIKKGIFTPSTGAPSHLVEREPRGDGHYVKMWPLAELSVTPTPASPYTTAAIKSLTEMDAELKGFDARQPRDDMGKWTDSAGRLSAGHAVAVMKHEGITDEKHHEAVRAAIADGTHKTREDVLYHIDRIHAENGKGPSGAERATTTPHVEWKPPQKKMEEMTDDEIVSHTRGIMKLDDEARQFRNAMAWAPVNTGNLPENIRKLPTDTSGKLSFAAANHAAPNIDVKEAHRLAKRLADGEYLHQPHVLSAYAVLMGKATEEGAAYFHAANRELNRRNAQRIIGRKSIFGDEETTEDQPSDEYKTESLDNLEAGLRDGLRFCDHLKRLRDATIEGTERFIGWAGEFDSIKAGRKVSRDTHAHLTALCDSMQDGANELRGFLDAHSPDGEDEPGDSGTEGKALFDDALKSYVERELALSGYEAT